MLAKREEVTKKNLSSIWAMFFGVRVGPTHFILGPSA
jgi:hypothetical protein